MEILSIFQAHYTEIILLIVLNHTNPDLLLHFFLQVCSCNLHFALKEVASPCLVFLVVVYKFRPKAMVNKAYRSLLLQWVGAVARKHSSFGDNSKQLPLFWTTGLVLSFV